MAVQGRTNNDPNSFIQFGDFNLEYATFEQDAVRSGALAAYTLLGYNTTSEKWVAYTDLSATDGTASPQGIAYCGLTEAEIKAGDTAQFPIYTGASNGKFDTAQLVIENSLTLDSIVLIPLSEKLSVREHLKRIGMTPITVTNTDQYENA